jgi:hypothetical protein
MSLLYPHNHAAQLQRRTEKDVKPPPSQDPIKRHHQQGLICEPLSSKARFDVARQPRPTASHQQS